MKGRLIKQEGIGYQTLGGNDYYLILDKKIYHTNPLTSGLTEGGKLSLKNCQAIELGYDLDAIIENNTNEYITTNIRKFNYGFEKGFQKALEILGDKKYSEQDVRDAYFHGEKDSYTKGGQTKEMENEFIQSLQQTEWDVEIVMEINLNGKNGLDRAKMIPKLDPDGCLILKRI